MKEINVLLKTYQVEFDCYLPSWYINTTCIGKFFCISLFYNTYGSYYILQIFQSPIGAIC